MERIIDVEDDGLSGTTKRSKEIPCEHALHEDDVGPFQLLGEPSDWLSAALSEARTGDRRRSPLLEGGEILENPQPRRRMSFPSVCNHQYAGRVQSFLTLGLVPRGGRLR